ncbi:MAG TPA: bifunctional phosphopantothenoylcysteine decarboxylase/phosphopantothenate--cysteine ligase CoaBC [Actinomycetota bacterium]|nr:bifunctional phosphopantothenoylcysteine decarboxylase/phosphopantothenate--cysteine ligase CoaBC [Actinomycetota bacterium]
MPGISQAQGAKILFCVTGGIAAYKAAQAVRDLAELGADVRVVMTQSATRFVGPQTFASLSGNVVATDLFSGGPDVPHVELARGVALAIVAPATANSIAKIAHGFADDLVSATLLTCTCPVLVVPAMHTEMWENTATADNIATLTSRVIHVLGPATGALSSGDVGPGRMVEPAEIVTAALEALGRSSELNGRLVLVTAGGTQEPIDPVRFIGNRSSGLMGYTIARAALRRGAKVVLVSGPTNLSPPPGVDLVRVRTAEEMEREVLRRARDADVIVKAGAVADFKPVESAGHKLKKAEGPPDIELVPTVDILAELGARPDLRKDGGLLVGFAAETEPDAEKLGRLAELKRDSKKADVIVANDVGSHDSGFEVPTNRAVIAGPGGTRDLGLVTKQTLAESLIEEISRIL